MLVEGRLLSKSNGSSTSGKAIKVLTVKIWDLELSATLEEAAEHEASGAEELEAEIECQYHQARFT